MLLKLPSKLLTLALFLGSLSYSAFSMEANTPSLFKTKEQIRLSLWYDGVYGQREVAPEKISNSSKNNKQLPVELSHPLNNWDL